MTVAVVAHRGEVGEHRENTLAAVSAALEAGVDAVEVDLRLTADGEVVVLHDATLARLWGRPSALAELTWEQVRASGGADLRIPSLREVLALMAGSGVTLLLDLDEVAPVAAAVLLVRQARAFLAPLEVAWCGVDAAMRRVRALDPDADVWMPWSSASPPTRTELQAVRPTTVNVPHLLVGASFVEAVHALGARVSCWTVDDPDQMAWLVSIGVDSVTTNRVAALQGVLDGEERDGPREAVPLGAGTGVSRTQLRRALLVARELAEWAAEVIRAGDVGSVAHKTHPADHVTGIDLAIERGVREVLGAQFPTHAVVGEEFGGEPGPGPCWYLDPVDGTANLAGGVPWCSVSLALAVGGAPVVAVVAEPWRHGEGPCVIEAAAGEGAWRGAQRLVLAGDAAPADPDPTDLADPTDPAHLADPTDPAHPADQTRTDPLRGQVVATELAAHQLWPGMEAFLRTLGERYVTARIMGSGTLTLTGVAAGRGCAALVHHFSPIDHLAAALIVHEAGGVVLDAEGGENLFPTEGGLLVARDRVTALSLHALWRASTALESVASSR